MAVTLAGTPSVYENASATSVALPYPTGVQVGELLTAHITHTNSSAAETNPGGWTLLFGADSISSSPSTTVWYKWADGSEAEGGIVTFPTHSSAGRVTGIMARWAGVDAATPIDSAVQNASTSLTTTMTVPSVTTVTNNAMVLHSIALNVSSSSDIATPSGLTRVAGSGGTGRKTVVFSEEKATAGSVGERTFTHTGTSGLNWTGMSFALRPADSSGGGGGGGGEDPPPPSDGDQLPPTGTSPTLTSRVVGLHDSPTTNARVQVKVSSAVSVRLKVALDSSFQTGRLYGPAVTPDSRGNARLTISGLQPGTRYYYRIVMKNSVGGEHDDTAAVGRLKTAPNGPASFSFCFASCNSGFDTTAFTAIANRGDEMFLHLGDLYYADGSGTGVDNFRSRMGTAITSAQVMWPVINSGYVPSDHDGMNNNGAAGSDATAWQNWNIARSELMPNPNSYWTFAWGPRVRFIMLDTRSFKSNPANTDNSSKTALGATQKQWFKTTIQNCTEPIIIIAQDTPWVSSADAGDDSWEGYKTEQTELGNFMNSVAGKHYIVLGGDMHALAAHNGVSGSLGNAANFQAAPIRTTSSHKGGPWTVGPYPSSGVSGTEQYGRVTITDTGGTTITVAFKGYSANDNVERLSLTKTYTVPAYQETTPGAQVQVRRAQISATPPTPLEVRVLRAAVSVPTGNAAVRIYSAGVAVVGSADPGVNIRNLSPGLSVTMTAVAPGEPVSYTWDQISGPIVTRTVEGAQCTYITPALKANATLVFRVVATYADGTKSGEGITRHDVVRTAHLTIHDDGTSSTVTFRPIEVGVPTGPGEEEPGTDPTPPPPVTGYKPVGGPANIQWSLQLSDDFNELNRQLWSPKLFNEGGINNTSGTYDRNVTVEGGELSLRLESSAAGAAISSNPRDGIAGHTGFEFTTGYLEARIFFPGSGPTMYNWPVFLTQGQAPLPHNGENDIAEVAGWATTTPGEMAAFYQYYQLGNKNTGKRIPGNWGGGWHTYALHRREDMVNDYYYDGVLVWSHVRNETSPHYIAIINEATGNAGFQVYGEASKVKVDYVRFWNQADEVDPSTFNAVRYVSNSTGNDSNPGTEAQPWKTIAKARTAIVSGEVGRGDAILLKRGDTWYENLVFPTVQKTTGHLNLGSYGTGSKPKLSGYKISNDAWVLHSTGIWKLNITANSGQYTGNTASTSTDVGFLKAGTSIHGGKKTTLAGLVSEWDFFSDFTHVYVRKDVSPGPNVHIAVNQHGVTLASNVNMWNINIVGQGGHGIVQPPSTNVRARYNVVEEIGGSMADATWRYGNGIEVQIGCSETLIDSNTVRQTYNAATTMQGTVNGVNKAWTNVAITRNVLENCNQMLELKAVGVAAADNGWINCTFNDNICREAGFSWGAQVRPDREGRGTFLLTYDMQLPIQLEMTRNTFYHALDNYAYTSAGVFPPINTHNNSIQLNAGLKIQFQRPEFIEQYEAWRTATGREAGTEFVVLNAPVVGVDGVQAAIVHNWGPVVRGDEFNYVGPPDPAKWSVYNSAGHAGNGLRRPSQLAVDGSVLRISGNEIGTTGGMSARFDVGLQPFYRVETRMRTSVRHPEYHPVLLFWPDNAGNVISGVPEIDYAEGTGDTTKIKFFLHYGTSSQTQAERVLDTTQWHNYACEWRSNVVIGYIDGVEWFRDSVLSHVPQIPMHTTIQLDWFPNDSPATNPPPCWLEVAWTREYNL